MGKNARSVNLRPQSLHFLAGLSICDQLFTLSRSRFFCKVWQGREGGNGIQCGQDGVLPFLRNPGCLCSEGPMLRFYRIQGMDSATQVLIGEMLAPGNQGIQYPACI